MTNRIPAWRSWLAIVLLLGQGLGPLLHLAGHTHGQTCQHAPAPATSGLELVAAVCADQACPLCTMIRQGWGMTEQTAPPANRIAWSTQAYRDPHPNDPHHAFDFNTADARGPPAVSPPAI